MVKTIEQTKDGMDSLIDSTHEAVVGAAERAERGIDSMAEKTHAAVLGAAQRAERGIDSMAEKTRATSGRVRDGAEKVSRSAHRHLEDAAKAVDRGFVRARSDLSRAAAATTDYAAENPGKTLLLAASAGFGLGMLVRWRYRRPEAAAPASEC